MQKKNSWKEVIQFQVFFFFTNVNFPLLELYAHET